MNLVTLQALAAFPTQLEAHSGAFSSVSVRWKPDSWAGIPSEPLSALEQICHLRDVEIIGYQQRISRTLTEATPTLPSLDTDQLVREHRYDQANATEVLAAFRAARTRTLAMVSGLTPTQLARPAHFEGYGPVTLRGLVHYLCSHDQQHLAGLQWLLGKLAR